MKLEPEVREAMGLKKEQEMFLRYASRPGAPKVESDYYHGLAQRTGSKINWKYLDPKRKKRDERREYERYE